MARSQRRRARTLGGKLASDECRGPPARDDTAQRLAGNSERCQALVLVPRQAMFALAISG
jgi:hypothetical protein